MLDYPTALEVKKERLLEGDTGRLVKATLETVGIGKEDVNVISALNCKPNSAKPKELKEAFLRCRSRLLRELRSLGTKKILCLGTLGYSALTGAEKLPRMDKVHGRWMPVYGMQMIATYPPTRVLIDTELFRDFVRTFEKFATTDSREPWPDINMWIPTTTRQTLNVLRDIGAFTNHQLSCDIETDGFNPITDNLLAVGFASMSDETSGDVLILNQELLQEDRIWWYIADQLEFGHTAFHNGRFDLKFFIREFQKRNLEYHFENIDDTMLLNYCLDERPMGRYGAHSLKNISRVRYDAPDYDVQMGKWIKEWKDPKTTEYRRRTMIDQLHTYLAMDCYYTARLARDLRNEVEEESPRLLDFYDWLLIPGTLALTDIEYRGCKINRPYLEKLDRQLERKAGRLLEDIQEITGDPEFNPSSSKQMYEYLYVKLGLPIVKTQRRGRLQEGPTSRPMLDILRHKVPEHRPFLETVIEYRRTKHLQGTYVRGVLSRLDSDDRIRGNYLLHGTATGRLSSIDPNLQNIPDKSYAGIDLRGAYIPTGKDWVIIEADYSQLELRVAAHLSGDKNLTRVYIEDGDLHDDVSEAVYHRRETSPYERWLIKRLVFGTLYGRGAASLATGPEMEYVESELGGKRWTLAETELFFKRFMAAYPKLKKWQEAQSALGYRDQVIETPLGRRRRFPMIGRNDNGTVGRQAMNTPIQSTASDITFSALIRIHHRLTELNDQIGRVVAHVVLTVHDSITTECHNDYLDDVVKIIGEEMERVPIRSGVPFKAKIETGANWGACK